jgi:hypothetical protein
VAALSQKRILRQKQAKSMALPATAATYFQGSTVGWNTTTGRIEKAAASTTFLPIGFATSDTVIASNGDLLDVTLFRELLLVYFDNLAADPVVAADRGSLCFMASDHEVAHSDATNTRSVMGRVWEVDALKGVGVEPRFIADRASTSPGLDT